MLVQIKWIVLSLLTGAILAKNVIFIDWSSYIPTSRILLHENL